MYPFTNFVYYYEVTHKHIMQLDKFYQRMDYLQKWHNGIQPQQCFYIINKHKLDLVEVMMGASNAIFINTCLTRLIMTIHLVLMLQNMLLPLVSMNLANLVNSKCLLSLWLK